MFRSLELDLLERIAKLLCISLQQIRNRKESSLGQGLSQVPESNIRPAQHPVWYDRRHTIRGEGAWAEQLLRKSKQQQL
jgi:hypothetical protein